MASPPADEQKRVGARAGKRALYYPPNNYTFPCVSFSFIYTLYPKLSTSPGKSHVVVALCLRKEKEKKGKEKDVPPSPPTPSSLSLFMFKMNNFARFVEIFHRFLPHL